MNELEALLLRCSERGITLCEEGHQLRIRAPKGALTSELRDTLASRKPEILDWLLAQKVQDDRLPQAGVDLAHRHEPFPLTDIQQAYWVGSHTGLEMAGGYHYYLEYDCAGLDPERLTRALGQLIARHDMLRAVLLPDFQQKILPEVPGYRIPVLDLEAAPEAERTRALAAVREELSHQASNLEHWPLFDIRLSRLGARRYRLHISLQLITLDGGSIMLLLREWDEFYRRADFAPAPLTFSFRDYVLAERQLDGTPAQERAKRYWFDRLDGLPPAPELPQRGGEGASPGAHAFTRLTRTLEPARWATLKRRASEAGLTPSGLLLTAFSEVLATWSRQPRFTLNLTLFNRQPLHPEASRIAGDFTSVNLLEVDGTSGRTFLERARALHRQLAQDLEHRHFPGIRVIQEWARRQKSFGKPVAPVIFTSTLVLDAEPAAGFRSSFGGQLAYALSQTPQVSLDHQVMEDEGGLTFHWDAVAGLYPDGMLEAMFGAYNALLDRLGEDSAAWSSPSMGPPAAQRALMAEANATSVPVPTGTLTERFLAWVASQPEAPAVLAPARSLTYRQLYALANEAGHWLRARGADRETTVGVLLPKGWEQYAAVFGVLLSGAAYVPIDPTLPAQRLRFLLEQCSTRRVLTHSALRERVSWPEGFEVLCVDQLGGESLPPLAPVQRAEDLAYVLYTSGSTGEPKGVMIEHRSVVNRMEDVARRFHLRPDDRVLALSALHHDLSVFDLLGMLCCVGGAAVLPEAEHVRDPLHWLERMRAERVTLWNSVPAFLQMAVDALELPDAGTPPTDLRWVILAGDFIPVTLPGRLRARLPAVEFIASGGPTETTVWDICERVDAVDPTWERIPYGRPMTNARYHVLKEDLSPCPVWTPGELYISGAGLARGFWRDEALTQKRFVTHPETGERLYRSGDLGRWLPDGRIDILGRVDLQVKIQGQRIELGEIDSALRAAPGLKTAVVEAVGAPGGPRRLVAYVVRESTAPALPAAFNDVPSSAVEDPLERMELRLARHQRGQPDPRGIFLPEAPLADRRTYLARQSHRRFLPTPVTLAQLAGVLSGLAPLPWDSSPIPKYRYPSAGSLYPVRAYVHVKSGGVEGLAAGCYRFEPLASQLVPVGALEEGAFAELYRGPNAGLVEQSALTLLLVGELAAIEPLYGPLARDFCLLEAGGMMQLLMAEAAGHQLGLCPLGLGADWTTLRPALGLDENHVLLHGLAAGAIDRSWSEDWMQFPSGRQAGDWRRRLQDFLAERLPAHMVPTAYVALDALPLTSNGKVDRRALPAPEAPVEPRAAEAPRGELEGTLAELLRDLLGVEQVSAHQNFFELGATSIHLARLRNRLQQHLRRPVSMTALFNHPTVNQLSRFLDQGVAHEAQRAEQDMAEAARRGAAQKDALARRRELLASRRGS